MPKGPRGEKRPADVVSAAVMVGRIATGEIEEPVTPPRQNAGNRKGGLQGGKARAKVLNAGERKAIAKKAAATRWAARDRGDGE